MRLTSFRGLFPQRAALAAEPGHSTNISSGCPQASLATIQTKAGEHRIGT